MKNSTSFLLILLSYQTLWAQIIDVHTHSYIGSELYAAGILNGVKPAKSADLHLRETIAEMDKNNIQFSVVSGSIESVEKYVKADARFIPGYSDIDNMVQLMPIAEFEQFIISGRIKVFGEIGSVYHGRTLNDPVYAPYLKIDFNVTDSFHILIKNGKIRTVKTSSNDVADFYKAKEWVKRYRPEFVEKACEGIWEGGPTPCECVQGIVKGFTEFTIEKNNNNQKLK